MIRALLLSPLLSLAASLPLAAQVTVYATVVGNPRKPAVGKAPSGLFRSSDSGATWTHLGPDNLKSYSMDAVDSSRGKILYIAADNGVHRSVDSGATWRLISGRQLSGVMDIQVDQEKPETLYAATSSGLRISTDGGSAWSPLPGMLQKRAVLRLDRMPVYEVVIGNQAVATPSWALRATCRDGAFLSRDDGLTWTDAGNKFSHTLEKDAATIIGPLHDQEDRFYAGERGVARLGPLDRRMFRPEQLFDDITGNLPKKGGHGFAVIGDERSEDVLLLAGTAEHGVWRLSHPNGDVSASREKNWTPRWEPTTLDRGQVWRIIVK
jgi:hypothetical protein